MYQRSCDIAVGLPFNIASYGLLLCLVCRHLDMKPGRLIIHLGDAHIYVEHEKALREQILRQPIENEAILCFDESCPKDIFEVARLASQDYSGSLPFCLKGFHSHPPINYELKV